MSSKPQGRARQYVRTALTGRENTPSNTQPRWEPWPYGARRKARKNSDQDSTSPAEQKADIQQQRTLRYQERKAQGICRDCDEPAVSGTARCVPHLARMRQYRKKYKDKKMAQAKEAKAG